MAYEIERKYLVNDPSVVEGLCGTKIAQGYIADNGMWVRVRIAGDQGFITLKGAATGITRAEFEYEIPLDDARELLAHHAKLGRLEKTRYLVPVEGLTFEVDVFERELAGLVTAEVELANEQVQVPRPEWLGEEVSLDMRYSNSELARTQCIPAKR